MSLISSIANQSGGNAYIILSFGQSNEGCACYDYPTAAGPEYDLPQGYNDREDFIKIAVDFERNYVGHTSPPRFESLEGSYWTGYGNRSYGYEQTFLRSIQQHLQRQIYFLRIAEGGRPIEYFMPGGALYDRIAPMINFVIDSQLAKGKKPVILLANWGQGEANQSDTSAQYYAKLNSVISYIRGLRPPYTSNIPFTLRKLSAGQTIFTNQAQINGAFDLAVANTANCFTYSPDDLSPAPVLYDEPGFNPGQRAHYTGPTQLRLGDYLYNLVTNFGLIP